MADHRLQIVLAAKDVTGTAFTKLQGRMTALTKSVVSLRGATVAVAGAAGIGMLIKSSLDAADNIGKTANKLGLTTDALQEYAFMASQSGVATRTMEMGLQRFTRRMAEAVQGKGELKSILEKYNIAVIDAAGNTRKNTDVLEDLADVIKHTEDPAERLRIAFKAFDSEGTALLNTMKNGSQGLKNWAQEARELGLVMDQNLIRASEKANDELDKLTKVIKVNLTSAIVSLAPDIAKITRDISNWTKQNKQDIEDLLAATGKLVTGFGKVLSVAGQIGEVTGVFGMIRHAANIGQPGGASGSWMEEGKEALNKYKEAITETVTETNNLANATTALKATVDTALKATVDTVAQAYQEQTEWSRDMYNTMTAESEISYSAMNEHNSAWAAHSQTNMITVADTATQAADTARQAFERTASYISDSMGTALTDMVTGAKTAKEAFQDMARAIINALIKMILKQIVFNTLSSMFGGTNSLFSFNFAKGGAFDQSGLVPFAQGGIVNRPTIFPFASGTGLMGEAGPEAILPLARTSGGDLGVKAEGGGGGTNNVYNIMAMDSRSIEETLRRNPGAVVKIVDDAMTSNGPLRSTMRRTM
jgi:lambda family phage tail tape measure protein